MIFGTENIENIFILSLAHNSLTLHLQSNQLYAAEMT